MDSRRSLLDEAAVRVGKGWSAQMREMADHIGAYRTLLISLRFGGRQIYIPADHRRSALLPVVGDGAAKVLSHVYRRERIIIPTARFAISVARRAPVMRAVRRGVLSISTGAAMLGTSRSYMSYLINHTDEGKTHFD